MKAFEIDQKALADILATFDAGQKAVWKELAGEPLDLALSREDANPEPRAHFDLADLLMDCAEEKTAFDHLESRRKAMDAAPQQVLAATGAPAKDADGADILAAWQTRMAGPVKGCR